MKTETVTTTYASWRKICAFLQSKGCSVTAGSASAEISNKNGKLLVVAEMPNALEVVITAPVGMLTPGGN